MNDPIITPPHFRNLPSSTSRFIQSVTTIAALVVCVVALTGFYLHHGNAR